MINGKEVMEPGIKRLFGVTILGWLFALFSVLGLLWIVPYIVAKGVFSASVMFMFAWNVFRCWRRTSQVEAMG